MISSSEREPLSKLRRLEKCGLGFSNSENSETPKRCALCAQTPCHHFKLVPHPSESLPKLPQAARCPTCACDAQPEPSVTFHARRYRSAQAGHLGLRARVGPAGTQPPHAQEPCPQILRRRRNGASTSTSSSNKIRPGYRRLRSILRKRLRSLF